MYAAVQEAIGGEAPDGLIVHLATALPAGTRHTSIWESRSRWEHFRDTRVAPAVRQVLDRAGLHAPVQAPDVSELDVVDVWVPESVPWASAAPDTTSA